MNLTKTVPGPDLCSVALCDPGGGDARPTRARLGHVRTRAFPPATLIYPHPHPVSPKGGFYHYRNRRKAPRFSGGI